MYLAEVHAEHKSYQRWECPRCDKEHSGFGVHASEGMNPSTTARNNTPGTPVPSASFRRVRGAEKMKDVRVQIDLARTLELVRLSKE